jgi:hypothetical protein
MPQRRALAFALALGCAWGCALACAQSTSFTCTDSSECTDGSFNGTCQPNGYCSFGDDTCPSGQRYGDLAAGDLAGTCVDLEGTTGSLSTSDTGDSTTFATLDGPALEESTRGETTSGSESSSTGALVVDESTSNPDTMTTLDTEDSGDTMSPPGCEMAPPDECSQCVYASCCQELIDCTFDKSCSCYFSCEDMVPGDTCMDVCGMSVVLDALNACVLESCGMDCGVMP